MSLAALSLTLAVALAPPLEAPAGAEAGSGCGERSLCLRAGEIALWPEVWLRAGYEAQLPSDDVAFIGHNDGFRLDQARLGFGVAGGSAWSARVLVEALRALPGQGPNDPVRPTAAALTEAWLHFQPSPYFFVRAGQQRMPESREGMTAQGAMPFASRSVAAGGVEPGRGFALEGMGPGRQLGLVVGAVAAPAGPFELEYRVALANGNGSNRNLNDNSLPGAYARFGATLLGHASLALGGAYNTARVGALPDLHDESTATGFAELAAGAFGFDLLALGFVRQVSFDTAVPEAGDPNREALGWGATSWLVAGDPFGLPTFGVRAGYRVSFYEPAVSFPALSLLEHAFAVRYDPEWVPFPLGIVLDYTNLWTLDDAGLASTGNHRLFALVNVGL